MFESILANFLTSRAAQFIKHIPQEQLRVGVWRGEIVLDDLELRPDCLDGLGLPLTLEAGYVGSLRISIPWSSLGTKPVVAELERIHLVFRLQVCVRIRENEYDVIVRNMHAR
jgi:vacuolar protein sorting-associated protein 13A/C